MQEKIQLLISGYFIGSLNESEQQELKNHLELNSVDRKIIGSCGRSQVKGLT
jgi:hypothetical protein